MDREKFLARLTEGRGIVLAALSELHEAYPGQTNAFDHWSVKDAFAHITAWQAKWIDWLLPVVEGKALDPKGPLHLGTEVDEVNVAIFQENASRSWDDIMKESHRLWENLKEIVPQLSESDLTDAKRFPWSNGRSLARRMNVTFHTHPQIHVTDLYLEHGEKGRAVEITRAFADLVGPDQLSGERAIAVYNLACIYSRTGQTEPALENLKTVLSLDPSLVEWSKQDPDFEPIRNSPAYAALYA